MNTEEPTMIGDLMIFCRQVFADLKDLFASFAMLVTRVSKLEKKTRTKIQKLKNKLNVFTEFQEVENKRLDQNTANTMIEIEAHCGMIQQLNEKVERLFTYHHKMENEYDNVEQLTGKQQTEIRNLELQSKELLLSNERKHKRICQLEMLFNEQAIINRNLEMQNTHLQQQVDFLKEHYKLTDQHFDLLTKKIQRLENPFSIFAKEGAD